MLGIKGTYDLTKEKLALYEYVLSVLSSVCKVFNYHKVETPILELKDLFARTLGDGSDVLSKEMFFIRSHTNSHAETVLRPENTAGIMRLLLENYRQDLPQSLWYYGPMFRYERPQKGRFRQFYQVGIENIGHSDSASDVETIVLCWDFLKKLGIENALTLEINSLGTQGERTHYKAALLEYLTPLKSQLSETSQKRLEVNILRILDTKCLEEKKLLEQAPRLQDFLGEESKERFENVCLLLASLQIPYKINSFLVRGLDYYSHTVFECIMAGEDSQDQKAVVGGGRYDDLATLLNPQVHIPAAGWAAGMERLVSVFQSNGLVKRVPEDSRPVALLCLKSTAMPLILKYADKIRGLSIPTVVLSEGSLKKKLKIAAKKNAQLAVFFGEKELLDDKVLVRCMDSGEESSARLENLCSFMSQKYYANVCRKNT